MHQDITNNNAMNILPNELINNIGQYCKTPDFISLRNTCSRFRSINYYPKRDIVVGKNNKTTIQLKISTQIFFMLSLTLLFMSMILMALGIILISVDMGNTTDIINAQITTGVILLVMSGIVLIIDILFVLTSMKLKSIRSLERITV